MADISKIRLEDETYNIKDQTARDNLENINEHINIEESNKIYINEKLTILKKISFPVNE
mgnify:CR=1 FL=1